MTEHFRAYVAVYMIFLKDEKILVARRANTGWEDGMYSLPSGHIDGNESSRAAAVREAREEIGVEVAPHDFEFGTVVHRLSGAREYVDFYFVAKKWSGEPKNCEPGKCDDLRWAPINELPENTVRSVREAVAATLGEIRYIESGWPDNI